MLRNLPFIIFEDVDIGVASLDHRAISAHCELVDTSVLSPVTADEDVTREDHTLGLLFEEINEVACDEGFGVSRDV